MGAAEGVHGLGMGEAVSSEETLSPGPWTVGWGENGRYEVRDHNGRVLAEVRREVDARAMAAAFGLLAGYSRVACDAEALHAALRTSET